VNKMNTISNRSSVVPILCEHREFSAIVERTQSDHSVHSPFRLQALDGKRVNDETGYRESFFFNI